MKKRNINDFIEKANFVHKNKYDYSKVKYNNCKEKVCIICSEHGEFWQTPDGHIQGRGCPVCRYINSSKNNTLTKESFIKKAKKIHGDKYDYSKVEYVNNRTKVCIICHEKDEFGNEHGEFWQDPTGHIDKKAGCPRCSKNHKYTTEEFLKKIPEWLKEKYDFSKFCYVRTHDKSILTCKEHGDFLISPHNILKGIGCPGCSESKLERCVRLFLKENNIEFISEYKHSSEFGKQSIDFYLPSYKIAIECQGIQHFTPIDFGGKGKEWAEFEYKHIIELDVNKQKLCNDNGIKLIYFTTEGNKNFITENENLHFNNYEIITNINDIKNYL